MSLSHNKICELTNQTFSPQISTGLQDFRCEECYLDRFGSDVSSPMSSLDDLTLRNNKLAQIPVLKPGWSHLDLSYNKINQTGGFSFLNLK